MGEMRNLGQPAKPPKRTRILRVILWLAGGVLIGVLAITGGYYFDQVTESNEFCGLLCHPNYPEYVTHEVSDHALVECGTCHIGPGLWPKVMAKVYGTEELYLLITNKYERPIAPPVARLRPAREICEQCHWPERFYEDRVRSASRFAEDEGNSQISEYLILRTGGGDNPPQPGPAIHWHIENPVLYVARDVERQDIPWVAVETSDGSLVEYWSQENPITAEELAGLERREMDCLDCHNRVTHVFRKPDLSLDEALAAGRIDRDLPYIKREGVRLLSQSYPSQDEGVAGMAGLADFYKAEYPATYSASRRAIDEAVEALQEIYSETVFPEMNVTWEAYADNIGHSDFPGCFRCHDGQHLTTEGDAVRLHCNICHSIPVITHPDQEPDLSDIVSFIAETEHEPESHLATNFIRDHRFQASEACADCHGDVEFGYDNGSFCANYACHSRNWPMADLDATFPHPIELAGQHAEALCNECHQGVNQPNVTQCADCHTPAQEIHFGDDCALCHDPAGWQASAQSWTAEVPLVPHPGEGLPDCLLCHSNGQVVPSPETHEGIPDQSCLLCHEATPIGAVTNVPHRVEGVDDCVKCHGSDQPSAFPATHQRVTGEFCLFCHEPAPLVRVSAIPHPLEGREDCVSCHRVGGLEPSPLDHKDRVNEACLLCHETN